MVMVTRSVNESGVKNQEGDVNGRESVCGMTQQKVLGKWKR